MPELSPKKLGKAVKVPALTALLTGADAVSVCQPCQPCACETEGPLRALVELSPDLSSCHLHVSVKDTRGLRAAQPEQHAALAPRAQIQLSLHSDSEHGGGSVTPKAAAMSDVSQALSPMVRPKDTTRLAPKLHVWVRLLGPFLVANHVSSGST